MSVPRFEQLLSDRIAIRPIRPDDVDAMWERRNDPTTAEFQNWTLPYPREKAQELVDEMVGFDAQPPPDGWIQMSIDDAVTGRPIGDLALGLTFAGRCAEVGWSVDADQRGRGIATEAAAMLAAWLFESVGVSRVSAMTHPDNLASVRVAERLGMVFEGHTRNSYWVGEVNSDDWIFAMTREDWSAWVGRSSSPPETVGFVEVTRENLVEVERMATHRSQQRFVATVPQSFADALVSKIRNGEPVESWYRGIEADGELVGFVMTTEPRPGQPSYYLRRLLIDRMHQRRGVGGRVLDLLIERARSLGADALQLSWVDGPGSPAPLYIGRGLEPTGEIEDGEIVARLDLS